MGPAQHLAWFEENTRWFLGLPSAVLTKPVPACPGWTVEQVITHLAYGLGLGYSLAVSAPPDCSQSAAFAGLRIPAKVPSGIKAMSEFERTMSSCIAAFKRTYPDTACYTYAGAGTAAFWFRRAAIETCLHRMDVFEALNSRTEELSVERATDAVAEAVEFALPLAAQWASVHPPTVSIRVDSTVFQLGEGGAVAEITGSPTGVLLALWGRSPEAIQIQGDEAAARDWLSVVETGFGGR